MDTASPTHPAMDPSLEERVLREQVASVYLTTYQSTFVVRILAMLVLAPFLYWHLRTPLVLVFSALHLAFYLHVHLSPRWRPDRPVSESRFWADRLVLTSTMLGFADGLVPWLFVPSGSLPVAAVLIVVMTGCCARAAQSLRPLKFALIGYTLPLMGNLIVALLWQGGGTYLFLAIFTAMYLVMMLRVGMQEHRQLIESLTLRFEKEALAARLKEQIAATERASAEKTRFLAAASHDLRQPMHAIALFGAAMQSALQDHAESGNAERLMRAVDTLGASLDTMLDVSRLDAGVVASEPRALKLDAMFLALNQTFAARAEQRNLQLRMRASGLWVRSDPQLLYRLLSNLIDNALKYTHRGGVSVTARARGQVVWVEVRDTGIGIAPEQLGRVFEEFYQIDNPGRDRGRGLGIGLSIVQRLSRLLEHPVQLRSRLGRGTRFRLLVPMAEAAAQASAELSIQDLESPDRRRFTPPELRGRVLLIDDEEEIRAAMTQLLRAYAIDLVAVADEAQAIEVLAAETRSSPFVLLLCDYRLADGGNGLEVGLRLRERFKLDAPLLLITGETAPERLQLARVAGVPMLFKPLSAGTLLRAMGELASNDESARVKHPMAEERRPDPVRRA